MSISIINLVKKTVSLFPPTWPPAVYNSLVRISLLKHIMTSVLRRLTPQSAVIPEGKVIFDPEDPVMASWLSLGQYEPEMVALFRSSVKEGMNVVDIGANLGYFTIISAHRVGPQGRVFSFEPDPHNFSLLQKNVATNDFKNVIVSPIALADKPGKRELFFGDNNTTHSFSDKRGRGKSEIVTTETLDNVLKGIGSPRVDIIKIDIEGAEPIAFEGMKETLARNPQVKIFFEFYPNAIERLGYDSLGFLKGLKEGGFSILVINEDGGALTGIDDIVAFVKSFPEKDFSRNLIATRSV